MSEKAKVPALDVPNEPGTSADEECRPSDTDKLDEQLMERFDRDSARLLTIFPAEIWDLILKRVTEPETLETITNSSLYFRHRLAKKRVLFLIPKVFGHIAIHLDLNGLMYSRAVSKIWNSTVDDFVENVFHDAWKKSWQMWQE